MSFGVSDCFHLIITGISSSSRAFRISSRGVKNVAPRWHDQLVDLVILRDKDLERRQLGTRRCVFGSRPGILTQLRQGHCHRSIRRMGLEQNGGSLFPVWPQLFGAEDLTQRHTHRLAAGGHSPNLSVASTDIEYGDTYGKPTWEVHNSVFVFLQVQSNEAQADVFSDVGNFELWTVSQVEVQHLSWKLYVNNSWTTISGDHEQPNLSRIGYSTYMSMNREAHRNTIGMILGWAFLLAVTLALASHKPRRHALECRRTEPSAQPHFFRHNLGSWVRP
jgi:hypothetical protein